MDSFDLHWCGQIAGGGYENPIKLIGGNWLAQFMRAMSFQASAVSGWV